MLKVPICYDNGGETIDRYTLISSGQVFRRGWGVYWEYIASNGNPTHPLGFWQHGELKEKPGTYLGKRVKFANLPDAVKSLYQWEYKCTHRPANVLGAWETSGGHAIAFNPVKAGPLMRYSVMWIPSVACDAPMVDTFIGKRASIKGQYVAWWSLPPYVHSTFFQHGTGHQ